MNKIVQDALKIARKEIGVREIGSSNRGRRVEEYQAADTLSGGGYPWCASFTAWCIKQATPKGTKYPFIPTASCDFILDWAKRQNVLSRTPQDGDVFLLLSKNNPNDAIHTGFVDKVTGASFTTIEGNTNNNGSANGNGVYTLTRTNSARYRFVRWGNLCAEQEQAKPWQVQIGAKKIPASLENGTAWIQVGAWAKALGVPVGWNNDAQVVMLGGRDVDSQPKLVGGKAFLPVKVLAAFSGLKLKVSPGLIEVTR